MKPLNLPPYSDMKLRLSAKGRHLVFDILRRRFVTLTSEEWVRQHFVNYLVHHLGYPAALLANEVELRVGEKRLRCDTVLYAQDKTPLMVFEYKSPDIPITEAVFNQILSYNTILGVHYLIMSNGIQHISLFIHPDTHKMCYLPQIPRYSDILASATSHNQ